MANGSDSSPLVTCPRCGSLLVLVPSGAVCSRSLNCGGLITGVDRFVRRAIEAETFRRWVLELPVATLERSIGRDGFGPGVALYRIAGLSGLWKTDGVVTKPHTSDGRVSPDRVIARVITGTARLPQSTPFVFLPTNGDA